MQLSPGRPRSTLPEWLPILLSLVIISLLLSSVYQASVAISHGSLIYALDDAYIHLSIARNLALNHVWGISSTVPASASSSPMWVLLLSALSLLPFDGALIPLILNFILALLFVATVFALAKPFLPNPWLRAGATLLLGFGLPVSALVLSGMENLLHCLLALVFVTLLALAPRTDVSAKRLLSFALFGLVMALVRYESMFLFVLPAAWGVFRKQPLLMAPFIGGVVGIVLFGLLSVRVGMPFIPNSLLLKSDLASNGGFFGAMVERIVTNVTPSPRLPSANYSVLAAAMAMVVTCFAAPKVRLVAAAVLLAIGLHVAFASVRQFYRYESYLIAAAGMVVLIACASALRNWRIAQGLAAILFAAALIARGSYGTQLTPLAVQNVYDQQYQMSQFLARHYEGKTVALNDIGACSYYTNCRIIDLYGLADQAVAIGKRDGTFNTAKMEETLRSGNVDVAILYPGWFRAFGGLPMPYYLRPVAVWKLDQPDIVLGARAVVLFAPAPKDRQLFENVREYESHLPNEVAIDYIRLGPP